MRVIGIDYGEKRIGVSVSDPSGMIASALSVLQNTRNLPEIFAKINSMVSQYGDVNEIIVGLPKTMKGEIGIQAEKVLRFVDALREKTDIPVKTWDERLTTAAVNRVLIDANLSRKKRKNVVDKSAACFMLQGYLDSKRGIKNEK